MEILACQNCGIVYKAEYADASTVCHVHDCTGRIEAHDEAVMEAVILLNQKGYKVKDSVFSRSFDRIQEVSITFEDFYNFKTYPNYPGLPEGFQLIASGTREDPPPVPVKILKHFDEGLSRIELHKQLAQTSIDLLRWAESL